jgi:alkylated DNA repair dioxygenase AlkB
MSVTYKLEDNATIIWKQKFMTNSFATKLFKELTKLNYEQPSINMYGKSIKIPRQQCWMANDNVSSANKTADKYADIRQKQKQLPWSPNVIKVKKSIEKMLGCTFDYVLINKYRDGNDHISYHNDEEAIDDNKNVIASVSLGATRKFVLRHIEWKTKDIPKKEFMLTHGSLIIMKDDTQKKWKHAIMKSKTVISERINLTFRIC